MSEKDFAASQIVQRDGQLSSATRWKERAALSSIVLVAYAAILAALAIENVWLFIGFVAVAVGVGYLLRRSPNVSVWAGGVFTRNRSFAAGVLAILLAAYPFVFQSNPYLVYLGALAAIFVIMALGLNITLGFAGLLDLGFAAYFAAGAYTSAQLTVIFGLNFWVALPIAGLVAAFVGFIIAWPALRVSDQYLALVTLGYGLIMNILHRNVRFLTNGTDGVLNIPPPSIGNFSFLQAIELGPVTLPYQANYYYLALLLVAVAIFASVRLRESRFGRALEAIREDQVAARCFGISLTHKKVVAFSTGAFFGGLGGAVFAHMLGFIHPDNFTFVTSMTLLVMVIAGGMGNIGGVALTAVALFMIPERLREFDSLRLLLFGAILLLLMIYRPQGLFPNIRRRRALKGDIAERGVDTVRSRLGIPARGEDANV